MKISAKLTTQFFKKWQKTNKYFHKDIQMVNEYIKRYSISLVIRKMQIKNIIRYYFAPTRMAKNCFKLTPPPNVGEDVSIWNSLTLLVGM